VLLFVLGIVTGVCVMKRREKEPARVTSKVMSVSSLDSVRVNNGDKKKGDERGNQTDNAETEHMRGERRDSLSAVPVIPGDDDREVECEDSDPEHVQTPGPPPRVANDQMDSAELEQDEEDEVDTDEEAHGMYEAGQVELQRVQTPDGGQTPGNGREGPGGFD